MSFQTIGVELPLTRTAEGLSQLYTQDIAGSGISRIKKLARNGTIDILELLHGAIDILEYQNLHQSLRYFLMGGM